MLKNILREHRFVVVLVVAVVLLVLLSVVPSPSASVGAWLYELARRSPDPRPELHTEEPFLVIGHRGSAGHAIENTMVSMRRAMEVDSANALEIDLCMTADSTVILWHDWDPDGAQAEVRESGTEPDVLARPHFPEEGSPYRKPVHLLTLDLFRQHYGYETGESENRVDATVPTLEEFSAWAAGVERLRVLFLDIKVPEEDSALAPAMIARIEGIIENAGLRCRIVYLTPHESIYKAIIRTAPNADVSFDAEPVAGVVLDPCSQSSVLHAVEHGKGAASIVIPYAYTVAPWTTARRIIECDLELRTGHNRKNPSRPIYPVIASTVNDSDQIKSLVGFGIDGLITDFPDRLRKAARDLGKKIE